MVVLDITLDELPREPLGCPDGPCVGSRGPSDRTADATGTGSPIVGIGMLNVVCFRNRLKVLFWDGSGLWVCTKRLERGRFSWPEPDSPSGCVTLSHEEFSLLVGGIDLSQTRRKNW